MSNSLWCHAACQAPCPSLSPRVLSNPYPLSWWCNLTISFSITLFSFCPQSFPASGAFLMSHLFASGGQSIGVSASASVLPMRIQGWFCAGWYMDKLKKHQQSGLYTTSGDEWLCLGLWWWKLLLKVSCVFTKSFLKFSHLWLGHCIENHQMWLSEKKGREGCKYILRQE